MRLSDVVNLFNFRFRVISNFVRYPIENITRIVERRAQNIYENIEIPWDKDKENLTGDNRTENNQTRQSFIRRKHSTGIQTKEFREGSIRDISSFNGRSSTIHFNGNNSQVLNQQLIDKQNNLDLLNLLPPLKPNAEIRGRRGRYRVESLNLNQESERVRLYQGIHVLNNKSVWIEEYLLPEFDFNQQETRETKEKFELLSTINFKNESGKDFRLITPWDTIASRDERRCYLITEFVDNRTTLREYLYNKQHPMTSKQVYKVLELVLVSLTYLHTDSKINLPLDRRPHGNLSLDSLIISTDELYDNNEDEQFFIYLSDFALWVNLFQPPNLKLSYPSVEKDLQDLGAIAFYLLHGGDTDPVYGHPLDPRNERHWVNISDTALKNFIRSLLGLDTTFVTAEDARIFLLTTLQPQVQNIGEYTNLEFQDEEQETNNDSKVIPIALVIIILSLVLGFVGGISWFLLHWIMTGKPPLMSAEKKSTCCIQEVQVTEALKEKPKLTYNAPISETTLKYLMKTENLVSAGKTFPEELRDRVQNSLGLQLDYQPVKNIDFAIKNFDNKDKIDFFITQLAYKLKGQLEDKDLKFETVAYEGIVVFIPFSYSRRENSFPTALDGKISFDDLRKIYSGQISNWKDLNQNLPDLPIKLYIPEDEVIVQEFRQVLFQNHAQERKLFDELIDNGKIIKKTTPKTLRNVLYEFESNDEGGIGIGFGVLSQIYNQCAVYPLSIGEKGKEIQALIQKNGEDINPKINLCKKGGYHPNAKAIKEKYPLKYPISIVYPQEHKESPGKVFIEILQTDEVQNLLREAGLVPVPNDN
ncbi:PstS family phosphate ABC transporter substrate-binding protein [Mastigocoleus testarum]|uniref:PBP domain-containing protein n=1 Tax=Mastigocoleus testarum BC008 TaxID=371196 RepID=A0A0V7ZMP8_9CYAN|nr:substrate-binding domain-containing protein [Mastigocoleus testarum]KST65694.1 hypothetical protein BC008_22200 [Mastigocoleus testarum BC008]